MECKQMQELFSPYLDKKTDSKESQLIEAHLQQCPQCQRQMEAMSRMVAFLKNLDNLQAPVSFTEDFHKHLSHEKIRLFPVRGLIQPKRTGGWIAAAVAGIALSIGIFASSFLPYGTMMASLQDWMSKDNKPSVAVVDNNKVIQNWINKHLDSQDPTTGNEIVNPTAQTGTNPLQTIKPDKTGIAPTVSKPITVAVQDKVVRDYTAKLQVDDMDKSMQDLIQVAQTSGAKINVKAAAVMAADSGSVKVVALQVPKDKVEGLLSDLAGMGIGTPVQDNTSYTETYTENQKVLSNLEQDIKNLQTSGSLSAQEQAQLQTLQQQQQDLQAEQARIDKAIDSVTVEVRMVETTNP